MCLGSGQHRSGGARVPVGVAGRNRPGPQIRAAPASLLVFGGIVSVQLGAGLVTALPRGFDVFVEGVPLGERALTMGAGKTF